MRLLILLTLSISSAILVGCTREDIVSNGVVSGQVKHHEWTVPGIKVYLKKDAKDFPGRDTSLYNLVSTASGMDAYYAFRGLPAGDYYLYATGYDSLFLAPVSGWRSVHIKDGLDIATADIAVSE